MKLSIVRIDDHGTLASEKVTIVVNEATNLEYYIIRDTSYISENRISNKWNHAHHLADQEVIKGDEVMLFTSTTSKTTEKINGGKNTRYFYSWDLKTPIWNNDGDAAVLYELTAWSSVKVKPAK